MVTDSARGDRTWVLRLTRPIPANEPPTLRFSYSGDGLSAAQLRVSDSLSYAGGGGEIWYPRLAFDSLSTGRLRFRVPVGQTVLANGVLDYSVSDTARGLFVFDIRQGARFGFVSANFRKYQTGPDSSGRVVGLYVLREREGAPVLLDRVASTIRVLERHFGPLPYDHYAVAEVDFGGSVSGTSEHGFFLADRSMFERGLPTPFIAHELAHAWWGNLITTKPGPGRMMLTEGIASYAMLRVLEELEGKRASDSYRSGRYPDYEVTGTPVEYFRLAAAGLERPIGTTVPRGQREIIQMHRLANTRGWFTLQMLSQEVGDTTFAAILRGIVSRYAGGAISWGEFRNAFETGVPDDISWFFDDWFDRIGAPELQLEWRTEGDRVVGAVTQQEPVFRVTVPVELRGSAGQRTVQRMATTGLRTPFAFQPGFTVVAVVLDPDYEVLRWTTERKAEAMRYAPLTRADFERRFGDQRQAVTLFRAALDSIVEPDTAGMRFQETYGLARALLATTDTSAAREAISDALSAPVRNAEMLPSVYLLAARLAFAAGDNLTALRAARDAITAEAAVGGATTVARSVRALPWFQDSPAPSPLY